MNAFGILILIAAAGSVAARYMKQRQELTVMAKLPADEAKAYFESINKTDRRRSWVLVGILFLAVAVFASAFLLRGA